MTENTAAYKHVPFNPVTFGLGGPLGPICAAQEAEGWRDVDSSRRRYGFSVWLTGAQAHVGRRLYRVRWWAR